MEGKISNRIKVDILKMLNLTNFQVKYLMKDKKNAEKIEKLQTFVLSHFLRKFFLMIMVLKICLFINQNLIR